MGSSKLWVFLAMLLMLLLALLMTSKGNDFFGNICEVVECGKGSRGVNTNYPLNYNCGCQPGWKRTQTMTMIRSLNYRCQSAPPPLSDTGFPHISCFDPCYWAYCGDGTCTKNRANTYRCECNPTHFNLLNLSVFPCYSQCTLGPDCSRLGI